VYLFGSLARGDARPSSDIDLAVLPRAGREVDAIYLEAAISRFVEDRLGIPTDAVVVQRHLSLPLLWEIFRLETVLYSADYDRAHAAACQARAAYREELPRLERIDERVRQRLTEMANALNPERG
ncbi:MAG: nucleotidyltransferase domain-containing protein, partial [Chloroflexi bacterium]|nr:nucleotidyltransferase domain-containing protein [Chloroflexota bacterium]